MVEEKKARAEWVTCIKHVWADTTTDSNAVREHNYRTWCGRWIHAGAFVFRTIDHAVANALNGGRLTMCPECVAAVQPHIVGDDSLAKAQNEQEAACG